MEFGDNVVEQRVLFVGNVVEWEYQDIMDYYLCEKMYYQVFFDF